MLLEAATTALPIVATDVGGNSEIVVEGKTGLLVPAADSVALRDAMRAVMAMPQLRRCEMGRIGREFVLANYSMGKIASEWEGIYREFLGAVSARGTYLPPTPRPTVSTSADPVTSQRKCSP